MTEQSPVNELIKVEKENQELLKELLKVTKSQRNHGRWKLGLESFKLIMWPLILILSFYFSMQVLKGFTDNIAQKANPINLIENFRDSDKPAPTGTEGLDVGRINGLLNLIGQ